MRSTSKVLDFVPETLTTRPSRVCAAAVTVKDARLGDAAVGVRAAVKRGVMVANCWVSMAAAAAVVVVECRRRARRQRGHPANVSDVWGVGIRTFGVVEFVLGVMWT